MSTETKVTHTPGPWRTKCAKAPTDGAFDYAVIADGQVIAEAFGRSGEAVYHDAEANARLIAAAPDLLEACKATVDYVEDFIQGRPELAEQMRAAIAKAEGAR